MKIGCNRACRKFNPHLPRPATVLAFLPRSAQRSILIARGQVCQPFIISVDLGQLL